VNILFVCILFMSRDSSVDVAMGYGLEGQGLICGKERVFLLSTASRPRLEPTQLPIQWTHRTPSPGVKWPGRDADHSPPSSAEVENGAILLFTHMSS
jgi:hypothetical protein